MLYTCTCRQQSGMPMMGCLPQALHFVLSTGMRMQEKGRLHWGRLVYTMPHPGTWCANSVYVAVLLNPCLACCKVCAAYGTKSCKRFMLHNFSQMRLATVGWCVLNVRCVQLCAYSVFSSTTFCLTARFYC